MDTTAKFQMTLNGDLIIRDITMGDAGDYICTATNDLGEDYSACRLDVQSKYNVMMSEIIIPLVSVFELHLFIFFGIIYF